MGSVSEKSTKREEELKKAQRKGQAVGAVAGAGAIATGAYALGKHINDHPDDYNDTIDYFSSGSLSESSPKPLYGNIMDDATGSESTLKTLARQISNSTVVMSICTGLRYTANGIIGGLASGGITTGWATLLAPTGYGILGGAAILGAGKACGFVYKKYKENQYKKQQRKQIAKENEMATAKSQEKSNPVVVNNATAMENVANTSQLTSSNFF